MTCIESVSYTHLNFHVGTIEGYPTFDTMLAQLKAGKAKRVTLIPMGPALVGLAQGDISSMAYNCLLYTSRCV